MNDGVPAAPEPSVEDRLAAYFTPQSSPPLKASFPPAQTQEESPAPEVSAEDAPEAPQQAAEDAAEQPEQASDAPPDGFVELEHLGKKYHVPPDLKTAGLVEVAALPDPAGEVIRMWQRPNGMTVGRMRVPIGVIGIIYESRPNVTADATSLCLKAGNVVILRGGSEAVHSNKAIVNILRDVARQHGIHKGAVTFIDLVDRNAIMELLKLEGIVDLIIPRGGEGLIRAVTENSRIPVLKHYKGVCHVFVDRDADLQMAQDICFNAKVQRPDLQCHGDHAR